MLVPSGERKRFVISFPAAPTIYFLFLNARHAKRKRKIPIKPGVGKGIVFLDS
jgi:hypothetical protein